MARINIEDDFWLEVGGLVAALSDQDRAIGQAVRFFRLAQEKHKKGKLVTEEEFARAGFSDALIGSFAERVDGGIKAIGAAKHFGWLKKRAAAGKAGGSKPKQTKAKQSKRKQPEASYSSSPSSSDSPSELVPTEPAAVGANEFVAAYCRRFKARWGDNPEILGSHAGIAKRLAKDLSLVRFDHLLEAYFSMPDAWLVKAKHPLGAFETKLNEVVVWADSGAFHTARQAREADSSATNAMLAEKVKRGEL